MDINSFIGLSLSFITAWLLLLDLRKPRNLISADSIPIKTTGTRSSSANPISLDSRLLDGVSDSVANPVPRSIPGSIPNSVPNLSSTGSPNPSTPYALKVEDATWCVAGFNPIKREPHCASGFAINPALIDRDASEGVFVITNHHVIANTGPEPMMSYQGNAKEDGNWYYGEVLKSNRQQDLALVFIRDAQSPIAKLAERVPEQPGLWVKAVGFPNDQPLTIRESEFIGMQHNCLAVVPCVGMSQGTITHGNSGGPLVAKELELMGSGHPEQEVVIGVNEGETHVEQAISITVVKEFLRAPDRETNSMPSMEPRPREQDLPRTRLPSQYRTKTRNP